LIKIADFGLSKAIADEIKDLETSQTPWIGTPLYMSPQVRRIKNYSR
jgi:serine/threonine protein kinase